jgi:hypothetical protein
MVNCIYQQLKKVLENNALGGLERLGSGFWNNVQAQRSLANNTNITDENGKVLNPATPAQALLVCLLREGLSDKTSGLRQAEHFSPMGQILDLLEGLRLEHGSVVGSGNMRQAL